MGLDAGGSVNLGSAHGTIQVGFDNASVNNALRNVENTLSGGLDRIGQRFSNIGSQLTVGLAPVTAFATQGLRAYMDFDDILNEIQARTGATADEMERVRATALQVGPAMGFSASEASQAMLELMASGSSLNESIQMLPDVLNLAVAGTLQLGQSADSLTNIMAIFKLGVEDSTKVVDILNGAAQSSSAEISDLIASFESGGAVAAGFGIGVEELAAIFAVLSESGIKGAEAGNQVRTMLTQLTRGTKDVDETLKELGVSLTDAEGNFRPLNDILLDLNQAMTETKTVSVAVGESLSADQQARLEEAEKAYANATRQILIYTDGLSVGAVTAEDAGAKIAQYTQVQANAAAVMAELTGSQEDVEYITRQVTRTQEQNFTAVKNLFGAYGQTAASVLLSNNGFLAMQDTMQDTVSAADVAAFRMGSLKNQTRLLGSTLQTLGINIIGPLAEKYIKPMVSGLINWLNGINETIAGNEKLAAIVGVVIGVLAVIGPVMLIVGKMFMLASAVITGVGAAMAFLLSPIGLLVIALVGLYLAFKNNLFGIADKLEPVFKAAGILIHGFRTQIDNIFSGTGTVWQNIRGMGDHIGRAAKALGLSSEQAGKLNRGFRGLMVSLEDSIDRALQFANAIKSEVGASFRSIVDAFKQGGLGEAIQRAFQEAGRLGSKLWNWVSDTLPDLNFKIGEMAGKAVRWFIETIIGLFKSTEGDGGGFGEWIKNAGVWLITTGLPRLLGFILRMQAELINGFVSGLAGEQWRMQDAFQSLINGVKEIDWGAIPGQIWDALGKAWDSIIEWIRSNAPAVGEQIRTWAYGLTDWISDEAIPWLGQKLGEFWDALILWIQTNAPAVGEQIRTWANGLTDWVSGAVNTLGVKLGEFWDALILWIQTNAPAVGEQIRSWKDGLVGWIGEAISGAALYLALFWLGIAVWIQTKKDAIRAKMAEWKDAFVEWVDNAKTDASTKLGEMWTNLQNWVTEKAEAIKTSVAAIGKGIVDGIQQGITDNWETFKTWFQDQVKGIIDSALGILGIHSPSTVFADIGKNIVAGLQVGVDSNMGNALGSMENLAQMMQMPMRAAMAGQMMPAVAGAMSNNTSSETYEINVNVTLPTDMAGVAPEQARQAGAAYAEGFGDRLRRELRDRR